MRTAVIPFLCLSGACLAKPFRIEVVDKENGWPVPLVELATTSNVSLVTDNAGVVAFDLPEFMGTETWLTVFSHGYQLPADGFGQRGVRITPQSGGTARIEIERKQIAKRLGRLTGAGLFAESQKFGEFANWKESGITGSDTVQTASYKGKLHWIWGDTHLPGYPLGIFHTSGATTGLKPLVSPKPPTGIRYDYIRNKEGKPRAVAEGLPGEGLTWLSGFVALPDREGRERLVATYARIKPPLEPVSFGLAEWDDREERFGHVMTFWEKKGEEKNPPPPYPDGHPVITRDKAGTEWLYFNGPPNFKCPANYEAWKDRGQWQKVDNPRRYPAADGSGDVEVSTAALAWNGHRGRWIMIIQQKFGKPSVFGEIWYVEGDSPEGPWGPAVKVATHENYTFYNMQIDSWLTDPDSPVLLFEGTYTHTFTNNQVKTPRYEYNQVLYRIDLDDPALEPARRK